MSLSHFCSKFPCGMTSNGCYDADCPNSGPAAPLPFGKEKKPFKIQYAKNETMGSYDVVLQVGGLKDEKQAKLFADYLAKWMTEDGGWEARIQ